MSIMKNLVVINTKTGEVQSIEKFVKNASDISMVGWIGAEGDTTISPDHTRRALQSAFQRLDKFEGNIQNLNHRLQLQEDYTYNHAHVEEGFKEINEDISKMVQGFDGKIVKIAEFLEDFERRLQIMEMLVKSEELEGSKGYTLETFDTIIKELKRQKKAIAAITPKKTITVPAKSKTITKKVPAKKNPIKPKK